MKTEVLAHETDHQLGINRIVQFVQMDPLASDSCCLILEYALVSLSLVHCQDGLPEHSTLCKHFT